MHAMSASVQLILYAAVAALSNALVSFAQKKAAPVSNLCFFLGTAAFVFFICNYVAGFLTRTEISLIPRTITDSKELLWAVVAGVALFVLYYAINNLIVRFGASMYLVYSVISVFFTSIVVGVLIFKARINGWHIMGIIVGCIAVTLITIGNGKR